MVLGAKNITVYYCYCENRRAYYECYIDLKRWFSICCERPSDSCILYVFVF